MSGAEKALNEKFRAVYEPMASAKYDFHATWFPQLLTVRHEANRIEMEFSLASDSPLDECELAAIGQVLDGTATSDSDPDGGCDSCGHGARVWVTVVLNAQAVSL